MLRNQLKEWISKSGKAKASESQSDLFLFGIIASLISTVQSILYSLILYILLVRNTRPARSKYMHLALLTHLMFQDMPVLQRNLSFGLFFDRRSHQRPCPHTSLWCPALLGHQTGMRVPWVKAGEDTADRGRCQQHVRWAEKASLTF